MFFCFEYLLVFYCNIFFCGSIRSKQVFVVALVIGFRFCVCLCVEFLVDSIYDLWSNIEHALGLFLTNKGKRLMTWTIGLGVDVLESEKDKSDEEMSRR